MQSVGGHRFTVKRAALVLLAMLGIVGLMASSGAAAPGNTTLVSDDGCCAAGDGESSSASVSADGRYVAFQSTSSLGAGGGVNHIYVRDRQTGLNETIDVSSEEVSGTGHAQGSQAPSISDNGRFVVFESYYPNLVRNDTNGKADVFLRDRQAGTTERISVNSNEGQGLEGSQVIPDSGGKPAAVSDDGSIVAFHSGYINMVPGDTNNKPDMFVRDRVAGTTQRISVDSNGRELGAENPQTGQTLPYRASKFPSISGDGRYVAYQTDAVQLTGGASNVNGVVVRDRQAGTTELVSVNNNETPANTESTVPSITNDGRYVAFASTATNLNTFEAGGDSNNASDIYLRDRTAGTTERVSVNSSEAQATGGTAGSIASSMSNDGRYVAFQSNATNLVAGDTNNVVDAFVRDRQEGTTQRASVTSSGQQAPSTSSGASLPAISGAGNVVAFESNAALVANDANNKKDIFVHELGAPPPPPDTTPPTVTAVSPPNLAAEAAPATNLTSTFSEDMRPATITTKTFKVVKQGTTVPVAGAVTYDATTKTATLDPSADLEAGTYRATVTIGAKDTAGNQLDQNATQAGSQGKSWTFTVAGAPTPPDTTPPTVTAVTPAEDATAVAAASNLTAAFSEAMQPASISSTTVRLVKLGTTPPAPVTATVTYDAASRIATLDPSADLEPGTYQATITIGAKDAAGNQLDQNATTTGSQGKIWRFTVA